MRKVEPLKLANSEHSYFRHTRWHGKRICPRCKYRYLYYLTDRYSCKRCRYNFGEFIDTYLDMLRISANITAHLLYLFALGVHAYRIRFYIPISLSTIERTY
ncbi:MAG: hypothetical protein KatS3mg003_1173 [Candidatus Nitrosocaldaceae archaeon]|nr:MAG: hypothetical protein KatS3mg003_1173 [Candidatus Nitrosocaldaceae archaeon]